MLVRDPHARELEEVVALATILLGHLTLLRGQIAHLVNRLEAYDIEHESLVVGCLEIDPLNVVPRDKDDIVLLRVVGHALRIGLEQDARVSDLDHVVNKTKQRDHSDGTAEANNNRPIGNRCAQADEQRTQNHICHRY